LITVIDSGICNLASVTTALERIGVRWSLGNTPEDIGAAVALILPGVGAFADGMQSLRLRGLVEPIRSYAASGRPILGICLGMQMLADQSEEFGNHEGLGLISGQVRRLPSLPGFRVPNIGWCNVHVTPGARLLDNQKEETSRTFYFVHSYYYECANPDDASAWLEIGRNRFAVALERNMIFGTQFHPEKSQEAGLEVLARFADLVKPYHD